MRIVILLSLCFLTKFVPTSRWSHDGFMIPRVAYDRLKSGLVTITLSFALMPFADS